MYIIKHALKGISRAKGRNILIGIIVFIISCAACVSLSIQEASDEAAKDAMEGLKITAQISVDREVMMQGKESMEDRQEALEGSKELTLDELKGYAEAESVDDFYYTASASFNGESVEALDLTGAGQEKLSTGAEDTKAYPSIQEGQMQESNGKRDGGRMGTQGDFTVTGYSSDAAMTDFVEGSSSITDGEMFAEGTQDQTCVIHEDLAAYNELEVGDTITLSNPNQESEMYTLTICGIYEKETAEDSVSGMMGGFMPGADSSNQIYTSYETLQTILAQSEASATTETDATTGRTTTTALQSMLNGTYTFASETDYETFQEEAADMGLPDTYTISSQNLNSYQESLKPLQNLSKYAGYFLIVIMVIGAVILIVLHIFSIRERKYEIGVLAAIGMKKWKIGVQFLVESLCVTFAALLIGAAVGAASSVSVTNALLEQQIESSSQEAQSQRFRREPGGESMGAPSGGTSEETMQKPQGGSAPFGNKMMAGASSYIDTISSATNLQVLLEMMGIGILLTIVSGCTALVFIMRYDPIQILSNRD